MMLRVLLCCALTPCFGWAQTPSEDPWKLLNYFEGTWEGTGSGESGTSSVNREYEFVLGGTFLQVKSRSTYPPQEKNPKGEIHEDWGFFSRDKSRKLLVLRQFTVEGFVNQYILSSSPDDSLTIAFVTEAIENIPAGWRARETYRVTGPDEFVETFDLAPPGKEFTPYAENRLRRVKKS